MAAEARFCQRCGSKAPDSTPSEAPDPLRDVLKVALGRQYEISHLLGKGGMGAVYLAREAALERDVAIKVLPPERGATQESRDRFRREARTAAKLSHPNIVPLHTFGDVDGTLYFVMGYVKGESLATRLKREGKLPVEESRRILIEVAEALDYAHKLGIVHRDIKPDNVLIDEATGRAMLTDFGIAKAVGAGQTMTTAGSILGTPHYMSPEQAQGKADIDARSDLYSLGVMGYAMISGRLPFEGGTPGDVMVQHITKEPPPLAAIASGVPPEIATTLTRCLEKDPEKRWPDAQSLRRGFAVPEGSSIPEDMVEVSVITQFVVAALLTCLLVALRRAVVVADPDPAAAYSLSAGDWLGFLTSGAILGWLIVLYLRHRRGRAWIEILRFAFIKPSWWFGSYPRPLRLSSDVWYRLPRDLRIARALLFHVVLADIAFVLLLQYSSAWSESYRLTGQKPALTLTLNQVPRAVALSALLLVVTSGIALVSSFVRYFWRWRRSVAKLRLGSFEANGLLFGDTARQSFWSRPEIAGLLMPRAPDREPPTTPSSAADLASAISAAVSTLAGGRSGLGQEIRDAARRLAESIGALDAQISALAASFDGDEASRLGSKIAAMGRPSSNDGDERRQMRDLLQKQLDLLRGLERRVEDLKARRARRLELLKALWLQTVALEAAGNDGPRTRESTNRIRKVFAQIDEHTRGQRAGGAKSGDTHPFSDLPTLER